MKKIFTITLLALVFLIACEKENESDSKSNFIEYQNEKYQLGQGYNVMFSELDCGNNDVFAYGLYLTDGIEISKLVNGNGMTLAWYGKGNISCFNLYCKSSKILEGTYSFVDSVKCSSYYIGGKPFTINVSDKYCSINGEMNDPTHFAIDVDLTLGWDNIVKGNEPSAGDYNKFNAYVLKRTGFKSGELKIAKKESIYEITLNCITQDGKSVNGKFTGELKEIEFGI